LHAPFVIGKQNKNSFAVNNAPTMDSVEIIIRQTKKWVTDVVAGCNFCPFVAREIRRDSIHYKVETAMDLAGSLQALLNECRRMDTENVETIL